MFLELISLTISLAVAAARFDYCSINAQNTLCLYGVNTTGPKCTKGYSSGVAETDRATILNAHNDMRRRVARGLEERGSPGPQPAASNMREMVWDEELAAMAQAWAQQCTFGHDQNRNVARFFVGQNVAVEMATAQLSSTNWVGQIEEWYNEVVNMDTSYVRNFPPNPSNGIIGHYTQMVWAGSYALGCGFTKYYDTSFHPRYPYKQLYVCNYGPAGNMLYSPIYKTGSAASACPTGTEVSNYLCALSD